MKPPFILNVHIYVTTYPPLLTPPSVTSEHQPLYFYIPVHSRRDYICYVLGKKLMRRGTPQTRGRTIPDARTSWPLIFFLTVAAAICGSSAWNLPHVTFLAPRILWYIPDFLENWCSPCFVPTFRRKCRIGVAVSSTYWRWSHCVSGGKSWRCTRLQIVAALKVTVSYLCFRWKGHQSWAQTPALRTHFKF